MAKPNRGGLGRGFSSLMGNNPGETYPVSGRTTNRERIVYDEREDKAYTVDENGNKTNIGNTGRFGSVGNPRETVETKNVSRETSEPVEEVKVPDATPAPIKEEQKPVEKPVVKEKKDDEKPSGEGVMEIDIELISPNPDQPRTNFKEEDLKELADSIKLEGVIQPILVRKVNDGYQIIAGERRWQASKLAGKKKVPVQIKNVSDEKAIELALIENIQRSDLNPIEEAYGYKRLMERNRMTQADIAQAVSKGRSTIANALRLLELPETAQQLLFEDKITAGHARAILSVPTKEGRESLTQKLAEKKLSVRETEQLARLMSNKPDKSKKKEPVPAVYKSVARALKNSLGTNVKVKSSNGKNKIEIEFKDERDLERIFDMISPE